MELESDGEFRQRFLRQLDRVAFIGIQKWQQRFGQAGQIPLRDRRLISIGVTALAIDRTEDRGGIVDVHECTRAVINRLPRERHIVGVHHPMNEADQQPLGDEGGLALDHSLQKRAGRIFGVRCFWKMAHSRVLRESAKFLQPTPCSRKLKCPHADVARRHSGENRPRQFGLTNDSLAGRRDRKAACSGDSQCMHGLADDVFPQHRTEGRATVSPARKRGSPRALELNIEAATIRREVLPEKNRPPVTQHGEVAELVTGISLCDRGRAIGNRISRKNRRSLAGVESVGIQAQRARQRVVENRQARLAHGHRISLRIKNLRQPFVGMIESPSDGM